MQIHTSTALIIMVTGAYKDVSLQSVAITQEAFRMAFGELAQV